VNQVIAITGVEPDRLYVDSGYHGHDYNKKDRCSSRDSGVA
jgi:transposase, IS5 family